MGPDDEEKYPREWFLAPIRRGRWVPNEIVGQQTVRPDSKPRKSGMVGPDGLVRNEVTVGYQPQVPYKRRLMLGSVDLPAKQGDPRSVSLGVGHEIKGVVGRARRATKHADDE